jgi:hypothetical protein
MRRLLPASLVALLVALLAAPAGAQESNIRPPMDLGADQVGTLRGFGDDLYRPLAQQTWWLDVGVSYPVSQLKDANWDAGLLVRVNHQFWRRDALRLNASMGVHFANDSYFNDGQEDLAFSGAASSIQTRHYYAWPAMLDVQLVPPISERMQPMFSIGPGVVWSSEGLITSAVNSGVGGNADSVVVIGPGGEQGISPYEIRTRTRFNLGWNARAGLGFRISGGDRPQWMRIVASGVTWYDHTDPRTMLGFVASFGR